MSKYAPTYWNHKGKYQKAIEAIQRDHIPAQGEADNPSAEAIRCAARLYYDAYNNGLGNLDLSYMQAIWKRLKALADSLFWTGAGEGDNGRAWTVLCEALDESVAFADSGCDGCPTDEWSPEVEKAFDDVIDALVRYAAGELGVDLETGEAA